MCPKWFWHLEGKNSPLNMFYQLCEGKFTFPPQSSYFLSVSPFFFSSFWCNHPSKTYSLLLDFPWKAKAAMQVPKKEDLLHDCCWDIFEHSFVFISWLFVSLERTEIKSWMEMRRRNYSLIFKRMNECYYCFFWKKRGKAKNNEEKWRKRKREKKKGKEKRKKWGKVSKSEEKRKKGKEKKKGKKRKRGKSKNWGKLRKVGEKRGKLRKKREEIS